jgi:hypothetical protein
LSIQKSIGPTQNYKGNENKMLEHRFAIAPMMDWAETGYPVKIIDMIAP